jgi:hypothetical protein
MEMRRSDWLFACVLLAVGIVGCAGAQSEPIPVEQPTVSATNPDRDDWPALKDQEVVFEGELSSVFKVRAGSVTGPDWLQLRWNAESISESLPVYGAGINDMAVGSRVRLTGKLRMIRHQPFHGAQQGAGAQEDMRTPWDEYLLEVTSIKRMCGSE